MKSLIGKDYALNIKEEGFLKEVKRLQEFREFMSKSLRKREK